MTTRVDLESRSISISVGALVGESDGRAIGLTGTGLSRLWIGQELHRRVQHELELCDPGFRAEYPVELSVEVDGWQVEISGRADGVVVHDERVLRVDEIKTLHFAVDLYNLYFDERLERYRRQLRLYAWMLSRAQHPADARLILVDIVSGDERVEEVDWNGDAVAAWVRQQVHRIVAVEQRKLRRVERMREAAQCLAFPHHVMRPAQQLIGDAVTHALDDGRHLLLSAPTGCGKTAAVLHPALKVALSSGRRLFFLTAKTLQQRIAVDTVRAMQEELFTSMQLRAKSKMCAHTEVVCHEEVCPYAREYGLKLVRSGLLKSLLDHEPHMDPDHVFTAAKNHELCPFELSLDLLPEIDLVVCDYNYVFDPTIGLHALVNGSALEDAILVVDEAHNLVDRSREYYSPTLDTALVDRSCEFLASRDNQTFERLATLSERLGDLVRQIVRETCGESFTGSRHADLPEADLAELRIAFDGAMLQYFVFKRENAMWMADDPVLDLFLALTRFHRILTLDGDEFVHLARREGDGLEALDIRCLDASRFLAAVIDMSAGAVAMSATLEPFDFYRNLLGFDLHRSDQMSVPSPFPPENRLVLCIDGPDTTYRQRALHYDAIASWISSLAHPQHNVLTLFPSYVFLEAVMERLPPTPHQLTAQRAGSTDSEQHDILEALQSASPQLLLAVLGGIFAEGIDYPGAMLSQVIVVSPGLPQFNPERQLLKSYYQQRYGHGFSYAYLVPGLTRVVQAAGRLLRSDQDRGVITLIGRRFQDPRYARLLPEEWTGGDPKSMLRDDPVAAVREFFSAP